MNRDRVTLNFLEWLAILELYTRCGTDCYTALHFFLKIKCYTVLYFFFENQKARNLCPR